MSFFSEMNNSFAEFEAETKHRINNNGTIQLIFCYVILFTSIIGVILFGDFLKSIISLLMGETIFSTIVGFGIVVIFAVFALSIFSLLSFGITYVSYKLARGYETSMIDFFICFTEKAVRKKRMKLFILNLLDFSKTFLFFYVFLFLILYLYFSVSYYTATGEFIGPIAVIIRYREFFENISLSMIFFALLASNRKYLKLCVSKTVFIDHPELSVIKIHELTKLLNKKNMQGSLEKYILFNTFKLISCLLVIPAFYYLPYITEFYAVLLKNRLYSGIDIT